MNTFLFFHDKEVKKELPCVEIDLPIYHCSVKILSKGNTTKLNKYWDNLVGAMCANDYLEQDSLVLIRINEYRDEHLVHELHHAVDMIMHHIGQPVNRPCEASAYLMGYLYKEAIKHKKKLAK